MICPLCQSDKGSFVVDSRDHGDVRRRRHTCYNCDKRYTTYEIPDVEYQRIQSMKINVSELDSVITSLRAIKVHFGDRNGNSKDQL